MNSVREISGHTVLKRLGESTHAEVFKVCRQGEPDSPMVLKRIKHRTNPDYTPSSLRQQFDSLRRLHIPGVIWFDSYVLEGEEVFLIEGYFEGMTLGDWARSQKEVSLLDFFKISSSLAGILHEIHRAGHIHGGIKPNNILIAPQTLEVRLIDLVRFFDVNELSHFIYDEGFRVNTLSYISPEQTGRIKQCVDFTTDFYSLGIVLYELLSGTIPFSSWDPLELIHSHLAEDPIPLHKKNPQTPEILSDIIEKLMEKEPERRYQTGRGLLCDLKHCEEEYLLSGRTGPFPLGLRDFTNRINIPSIMVGRGEEKALLLKEHALSCSGVFRSAMISGPPGIGKTRLIQELQVPIIENRGYFTSGKYDQYQKNVPYSTLIQAFRNLMRAFLTEDGERIIYWKETISKAVGVNGKILTDMIPESELIIGPQPEVDPLPPIEALNRFKDIARRFISCLAGPDHPLTLFVDDLQWCDPATFEIIEEIHKNAEDYPYLFLLGAYRHNEVGEGHPLSHLLQKVMETKIPLLELRLRELGQDHCNEMVSYILNTSPSKTECLSEIICATSEGNPLYINESLSWLYDSSLIDLVEDGTWQWDDGEIRGSQIPDTTVSLFSDKVRRLPPTTLGILQIAACLGVSFRAEDLSLLVGKGTVDLHIDLAHAFEQRILLKGKSYISFFHDRVQEAVYSTIGDEDRRAIHRHISETYIKAIPPGKDPESLDNLFAIVEHLNRGEVRSPDKETLYQQAKFNYSAGIKSMNTLALESANHYFRKSRSVLPEGSWDTDYAFTFLLYKNLAKSELAQGKQMESEALLKILLKRSKTDLDRVECLAEQSTNLLSLGEYQRSIDIANQGLAYLDRSIPDDEGSVDIKIREYEDAIRVLSLSPLEILNKGPILKRRDLIELTFYNQQLSAYYAIGQAQKTFLVAIQGTYLSLLAGLHSLSVCPVSVYSAHLLQQGIYEDAFIYEDLAIELCDRFPDTIGTASALTSISWLSFHWRNHLSKVFEMSVRAVESGKRSGTTFYTGIAYFAAIWSLVSQGHDLNLVQDYVLECEDYSKRYNLPFSLDMAKGLRAAWVERMKTGCIEVNMEQDLERWSQSGDFTLLGNYHIYSGVINYYLGDYKAAGEQIEQAESYLIGHISNIPNRMWHIFFVLNTLSLLQTDGLDRDRETAMAKIEPVIERLEEWSSFGPALNPYLALIKAELKKVDGDFRKARNLYLDAIDIAHEHEYTLLEGHIHECLGELFYQQGNKQVHFHINEAANLYERCHADAKLKLIKERYDHHISVAHEKAPEGTPTAKRIDTQYLMKASMAISQELDLNELLKTIMKLIMERLGAQTGWIITEGGGSLLIRVQGTRERVLKVVLKEEPLSETKGLGKAIVRYVHRTKETVVLKDAMKEGPFAGDREVQDLKLRSVLCQPIMKQQKLVGILYLQNRLIKSVFTGEEIELARLLTSQAAVSIENAKLVDAMKKGEEALRESEERFRSLSENAPDIIFTLDKVGAITYVNPAWEEILGHSKEEVLGRYFLDFSRKENTEYYLNLFKRVTVGMERIRDVHGTLLHKDGSERSFNICASPNLDSLGRLTGGVGLIKDITERNRLEAQLRQAQKMEAIGTLAGGIAHDFNNLLMGIQGNASLMYLGIDGGHPHYERLKNIVQLVEDGTKLTGQLLGFAKGGKYEVKPTDINDLIEKGSSMFGRTKKEVRVHRKYQRDIWTVEVDRGQIEQVLLNLYVNAWQAMPGGGELFLETQNTTLGEGGAKALSLAPGDYVKISVTDTGIGMDEATKQKIFDPFFTTKGMGRGTGLGLASAYGIISNHGGMITVDSKRGVGTTFTIYLLAVEKEVPEDKESTFELLKGEETILFADDEDTIVDLCVEMLEEIGYKVLVARSGREAVRVYKGNKDKIDMVILDMIMPNMGGGEAYDRMKKINPDIKVLLSSGYSIDSEAADILRRGCDGFIQKPFGLKEFSQKVREILDNTQQ